MELNDYTVLNTGVSMADLGVLTSRGFLKTDDSINYAFNLNSSDLSNLLPQYNIKPTDLKSQKIIVGISKVKKLVGDTSNELDSLTGTNFLVAKTKELPSNKQNSILGLLKKAVWL